MSLIHKALRKADGEARPPAGEPPVEAFVGEKLGGIRSQLTPRTIVLLVVAVLALVFTIYKKVHVKSTTFAPAPVQTAGNSPVQPPSLETLPVPTTSVAGAKALPDDPLIIEAKSLYGAGKFDDALAKLGQANAKNPSDPVVFNNIGLIYKKKNDFAQAEGYYKKALALKPDYPECLNNMGVLKAAAGDALAASIYLKKAVASDSTYADAYFNLAVLNDSEGNYRDAIANYKLFLQYTDSSDEAFVSKVKERVEELSE